MTTEQSYEGPSKLNQAGACRQARASNDGRPVAADPRGSETILVVDDEEPMQRVVRRILLARGYQVLLAGSREEALEVSRQHEGPIDLILSDLHLARESGPALVEKLSAERPEAKVLFMSGHSANAVQRSELLNTNANFIEKPFQNDAFARKVREVLDS